MSLAQNNKFSKLNLAGTNLTNFPQRIFELENLQDIKLLSLSSCPSFSFIKPLVDRLFLSALLLYSLTDNPDSLIETFAKLLWTRISSDQAVPPFTQIKFLFCFYSNLPSFINLTSTTSLSLVLSFGHQNLRKGFLKRALLHPFSRGFKNCRRFPYFPN